MKKKLYICPKSSVFNLNLANSILTLSFSGETATGTLSSEEVEGNAMSRSGSFWDDED